MPTECRKCKKRGLSDCVGPCYDHCMCDHCWNGWNKLPRWRRIVWRIQYLWRGGDE